MSLSAKRFSSVASTINTLSQELANEGLAYERNKIVWEDMPSRIPEIETKYTNFSAIVRPNHELQSLLGLSIKQNALPIEYVVTDYLPPWQVGAQFLNDVKTGRYQHLTKEEFKELVKGKTPGARYAIYKVQSNSTQWQPIDQPYKEIFEEWRQKLKLKKWIETKSCYLDRELVSPESPYHTYDTYQKAFGLTSGALHYIGLRDGFQAERFFEWWRHMAVVGRPFGSSHNPNPQAVAKLALTPNYNKLPMWVKKQLVRQRVVRHDTERVGNIWRLIDCAKAWKWCNVLPKNIAGKVGKMPVRSRLIASFAWNKASVDIRSDLFAGFECYLDCEQKTRAEVQGDFWRIFKDMHKISNVQLISLILDMMSGTNCIITSIEVVLNLPHKILRDELKPVWDKSYESNQDLLNAALSTIEGYLNPKEVCQHYFGTSGKATIKAFQSSKLNNIRWASVLAYGNPDMVQKYLTIDVPTIEFEKEVVPFLKALVPQTALKMVQTTTFKIRGEVKQVTSDHVRDTGYLWEKLAPNFPEMGRIRCWFSVHEHLAAEYVARTPDFELQVNPRFAPLDGLCDVKGEWELRLPTCNQELKMAGEKLKNCLGGYGDAVNSGRSVIILVKIGGYVEYAIEMTPYSDSYNCQQFYGYRNSYAPSELRTSILQALAQAGVYKN